MSPTDTVRPMKGRVIVYDKSSSSGLIETADKERKNYRFRWADWNGAKTPRIGMAVEFEIVGDAAGNVTPVGEGAVMKRRREGDEVREWREMPMLALAGVVVGTFVALWMTGLAAMNVGDSPDDPLTCLIGVFFATVSIAVSSAGMVAHEKGLMLGGVGVIIGFYAWLIGLWSVMVMIPSVAG